MATRLLADRYELLEKIGDGGMAVVYKAKDRLLNRFVAIKILRPEFAKDLKFIENFRRESQSAAGLSHPHIVNIYDVGREGNVHYIVMELIEGAILSDMIKESGSIEWHRSVEITKQIASALAFAHKNHIIHRDVKPHNILITEDGTAKITDFGIAKALNTGVDEKTETVMGSVHYFSPEQAKGGYVDEKSDIYSLGIVLYELLTGHVPFDGDNPVSVALMHINDEMIPPRQLDPSIPESLEKVVMKATDKIQVNRYATADEMLKALEDVEFIEMLNGSRSSATANAASEMTLPEKERPTRSRESESAEIGTEGAKKNGGFSGGRFNKYMVLGIIAALIVAIPLSIGVVHLFGNAFSDDERKDEFEVPDFCGMTLEQAEATAAEYELEIQVGDYVYSSEYDEGEITSQVPDKPAMIKAGKTITVNISKGVTEGTVPKITGRTYDSAVYMIEKYGFKVGNVSVQVSSQPKDIVLSQSPAAGEEATPGSYITFVVSSGKEEGEAIVPYLIGMTVEEAEAALDEAGLMIGDAVLERNGEYPEGQIIWQEYPADTSVAEFTPVKVRVSNGDVDVDEGGEGSEGGEGTPGSIPLYIDFSSAPDAVFWLSVVIADEEGTHTIVGREERQKEAGGETVTLTGTGKGTVTVIFNNDVIIYSNVDFNTGVIE